MEPRIEDIPEKKLIGNRIRMTLVADRTVELWGNFMTRRGQIKNKTGPELYSIRVYDPVYFNNINPEIEFDKWAAIEVTEFDKIPAGMETITINGLYAVFLYIGVASEGINLFRYIFHTWLPKSGFVLDDRPHFEIMGDKYKHDDPVSEEEFWIPLKRN